MKRYELILVTAVLLLLAACGAPPQPAVPVGGAQTAEPPTADPQDEDSTGAEEEAASEAGGGELMSDETVDLVEPAAANADPAAETGADAQATYQGVPVGFTEEGRAYIGDLDAPVVIEEFSDYQCPYCSRFYENTLPAVLSGPIQNGEAVLIYYDFPLDIHPQAPAAANAARCAGEQDAAAYWQMHDELFKGMSAWSIAQPQPIFENYAADLELDVEAFTVCMDEERYYDDISTDLGIGRERGVTGTPTFFLNDQMLVGAQPAAAFNGAIETVAGGESIVRESPQPQQAAEIPPFEMPEPITVNEEYAAVMGSEDAPILIVEYTDYQCPYCGRHSMQTLPQVVLNLVETGRVRYALKDFPLDNIHAEARDAAVAARCAGEQDAYWEMHDLLFARQDQWGGQNDLGERFGGYAADLGLDTADFAQCYNSGKYDTAVQANLDEGTSIGITGTPGFVIGGYTVSGAQPYDVFELVVTNLEEGTIEQLFRDAYDRQVEAYRQQLAQQQQQQQAPPEPQGPVDVPVEGAFAIGDEDAPVTIVEYTDFQCPYCGRHFEQTFPRIKENYIDTGIVRYVFKDFPLDFHLQAPKAAEAARCAQEQDAFMAMHNVLFSGQQAWSGQGNAADLFVGYADEMGLDTAAFTTCLDSGRYTDAVQADLQEALSFGLSGTPSFFINGQPLIGAVPYSTFVQAIESVRDQQ